MGADLPTGTTGSAAGGTTDGTPGAEGGTTGDSALPALGDAATDMAFASDGAAPAFASMVGTGDATGYAEIDYDYEEAHGSGGLYLYGFLGDWNGPYQAIQCEFDHATFVKVGTKLKLTYGVYDARVGDGDDSAWEGLEGGTAEVVAMGPGLSVTVELDGLKFRSLDDEKTILTLSGTIKSPAEPPTVSSTPGDGGGTTGATGGVALPALSSRGLRRHQR